MTNSGFGAANKNDTEYIGSYAIIIGAMKSGTTTLHGLMSRHPQIAPSSPKEINFFSNRYSPDVKKYDDNFLYEEGKNSYALESSTNYTKAPRWSETASRISKLPGRKRLIYILRDPIDRIDSHIAHNVAKRRLKPQNFDAADIDEKIVGVSSYAKQMQIYESAGLLKDIMLLDFKELCDNPKCVVDKVSEFLGIDRFDPPELGALNARRIDQSFLSDSGREYCRVVLRPDVRTLIERYGFEPARSWGIV